MPRVKPEAPREEQSGFPAPSEAEPHPAAEAGDLWEQFLSRGNLAAALRRVEQNAGAPVTGIPDGKAWEWANSRLGYWRIAGLWVLTRSLTNAYWREQGLQGFTDPYRRLRDVTRTAGCGPARPVVWEGRG